MIWEYCGNTEDYPEATRCYCCSLNIFHSRAEHDKILASGWKPKPHMVKARERHHNPRMSEDTIRRRTETLKKRREFHDRIWKDAVS